MFHNIETGHFERSLSGVTAVAAVITSAEIYLEHYRASFGNKLMWSPILVTPPVAIAGVMGIFSQRWAKTWLPLTSAIYTANGLLGLYLHMRGVGRRPGGWKGLLQPSHGTAADRPRPDDDRGCAGIARGRPAPGGLRRCRT